MWADALWRLKIQAEFESTRRGPRPRQSRTGVKPVCQTLRAARDKRDAQESN
jgi:hypothetical protein